MFENQNTYPATISTRTTVNQYTKLYFASNKFLKGKIITGITVFPFQEFDSGTFQYVGEQLKGTQAPFEFTSLTIDDLIDGGDGSYSLNLVDDNDEIVLFNIPLSNFIFYPEPLDPVFIAVYGDKVNRQPIFKLKNINLEKSYITGGMQAGKGIYFVFNYM